jgi:hypothetical protein
MTSLCTEESSLFRNMLIKIGFQRQDSQADLAQD